MKTIGIIGSSGRNMNISKTQYQEAIDAVNDVLRDDFTLMNKYKIILLSGGSSFSDHIAIELFNRYRDYLKLQLNLPCKWSYTTESFDKTSYEGQKLNELHNKFSKEVQKDTLMELHNAVTDPLVCTCMIDGFYTRNIAMAKVNKLVAVTFSNELTKGTARIYKHCRGEKIIINV